MHDAVEETTDWIYGFFSLLSDIISSEEEEDEDAEEDVDKGTEKPRDITGCWDWEQKCVIVACLGFSPNEHWVVRKQNELTSECSKYLNRLPNALNRSLVRILEFICHYGKKTKIKCCHYGIIIIKWVLRLTL